MVVAHRMPQAQHYDLQLPSDASRPSVSLTEDVTQQLCRSSEGFSHLPQRQPVVGRAASKSCSQGEASALRRKK